MVTLKQLKKMVDAYLTVHGDKEILSFSTYSGSSPVKFEIYLSDIYNGSIGTNPFTGKDSIKLYESGETGDKITGGLDKETLDQLYRMGLIRRDEMGLAIKQFGLKQNREAEI